jgi:hypothetical protein
MNDREFIELLNLYVDREISADDALRLEAEVGADPERRRVYDQYCRMQKACSMLSTELADSRAFQTERRVLNRPVSSVWRFRPMVAGLAAAACLVVVYGLKYRAAQGRDATTLATVAPDQPRTVPETVDVALARDSMEPVFTARRPGSPTGRAEPKAMFPVAEETPSLAQLDWIGDVRLAPVFPSANPDLLLAPKAELKTGITDDAANSRFLPNASEMTAFRFQR